ncbi:MAG: diguanylate cyclase [Candidatus Omnitrophica bacterium]|nr:diguanylate cyclase [Candidatus Omnitrophota bacterium]
MKKKVTAKQQLMKAINALQQQIKKLGKIGPGLENKEKELKEYEKTLEDRVSTRTSAERVIQRLLRAEIEQRKKLEQTVEDALEYANGIINTVRDSLIILDADLKVVSASRSFYQFFKVKPEDTEKQHIYELGDRQWDIPRLRELLEDILPHTTSFDDFEVEHDFPGIGTRTMLLNARKVYRKTNHTQLILLAIEDITAYKEAEEKLKNLASHDELTGCVNFRSIMELLETELARSKRYQKTFSIVMIDIDHFKKINDDHGHLAGNDVLIAFAHVVKRSIRSIDIVGRYGGDEFMLVFPETDAQQALVVLERVRNYFNRTKITLPQAKDAGEFTLEFSAGVAVFPCNARDLKELIWIADNALRQAKRQGKNRAVLERRRLVRLNPIPGARIEVVDSSGKENMNPPQIANISQEGMLLLSTQDILDEELLCRIYCPKNKSPFELICKVKHKSKQESELYRIGVYFPEVPDSMNENLSNCIEPPAETA